MSIIPFYDSRAWRRKRKDILRKYNNECQECKRRHIHTQAVIVHHIYHLDEYPQYGLEEFVHDPVTGETHQNLWPVCRECHETVCHPERVRKATKYKPPLTEERW